MEDKSLRQETIDKQRDLYHAVIEEDITTSRIARLNYQREITLKKLVSESSMIEAIDTELAGLMPQRAELEKRTKVAETAAKQAGKELHLSGAHPDVLKKELGGVLQARDTEKFVIQEEGAKAWLLREVDRLPEGAAASALKIDRKAFEKLAKRTGPHFGVRRLDEVATWEDTTTMALQRKKLAEWIPPDVEDAIITEDEAVDSAVERLMEESVTEESEFLNTPIEGLSYD